MLSHQSDCSGKVNCISVITICKLANFLAPKQTLPVSDNVINTYNYPIYLTAVCKLAPVFVVKVSKPYFSTRPQGTREKFGLDTQALSHFTILPAMKRPGNKTYHNFVSF